MRPRGNLEALDNHVAAFWPSNGQENMTWEHGPVLERVPGFHVRRVAPLRPGDPWIYVSIGTSLVRQGVGLEFFIISPVESMLHVETLAMVAHFHSFDVHALDVGSTLNLGRPWLPGSLFDHMVVALPYPYGPRLEIASNVTNGARFLWLVPISKSESLFIKSRGFDNFEDLIEASEVNILDPQRKTVA